MDSDTYQTLGFVFGFAFGCMFWSVHLCLFLWFLHIASIKSNINNYLRFACVFGFVLSTAVLVLESCWTWNTLRWGYDAFNGNSRTGHGAAIIGACLDWIYFTSVVISDAVQIWRTMVIRGRSDVLLYLLSFLYVVTVVTGLISLITGSIDINGSFSPHTVDILDEVFKVTIDLSFVASLCVNIVATSAVVMHIRSHIVNSRAVLSTNDWPRKRFGRLVALLIDAGILFALSQLYYLLVVIILPKTSVDGHQVLVAMGRVRPVIQTIACAYPTVTTVFAFATGSFAQDYVASSSLTLKEHPLTHLGQSDDDDDRHLDRRSRVHLSFGPVASSTTQASGQDSDGFMAKLGHPQVFREHQEECRKETIPSTV